MDPLHVGPGPQQIGYVILEDGVRLYYERWALLLAAPRGRIILIMGAFGTCQHWAPTADFLRGLSYEVGLNRA
jgi:alpha-beta hydrolase superfamily lysophospholipase